MKKLIFHVKDKKICIMVDCETTDGLPFDVIKNADILIYDGMFDKSEYENKVGWGHSTWQKAVELAKQAEVSHLIITHHDPASRDSKLRAREKKAKELFRNTEFARNGSRLTVHSEA